jgi:glycosyltransferase involved in cell wall biosynthesis
MQIATLIIPALNEAASIGGVLRAVPPEYSEDVIVVDGGSQDDTVAIARAEGARVVHEPRRGYGRACAAGVAAARGELLLFMDGDGADDPADIPLVAGPVERCRADLVLGSRLAGCILPGAMPWHQRFGNRLSAWLIRRLHSLPITDLGPFRAVRREALLALEMEEMTYGWPTEMMVKGVRAGWRIVEVPVTYRSRAGGRSKISGTVRGTVGATYHILRIILSHAGSRQGCLL